jgi:steroid delta-isomerase-like uncharacterized protein
MRIAVTGAFGYSGRYSELMAAAARGSRLVFGGRPGAMKDEILFLEYIKAYNAKDVRAMLTFFAEDCIFENVSGGKVTAHTNGKAELESLARASAGAFASREQKVISITQGQGRVVAEIDYHAILQADLSPELKAGSRLELRGVSVLEISGGKIVRLTDYS